MAKRLLWGYIDEWGEFAIPPRFDDAWDFYEDLAAVKVEWARGYIDRKGEFVIEPRFEKAEPFHDGVARVMLDGEWLYINRKGEPVAEPAESSGEATDRKEEYPQPRREGEKVGYVDAEGEWVIAPTFTEAEPFCEGRARVRKGRTSKWGFIDPTGHSAFKATFEQVEDFHDGLARVLTKVDA